MTDVASDKTLTPKHRIAIDWYMRGFTKRHSCIKAGFSPASAKDIFSYPPVVEEIARRQAVMDSKSEKDLEWLCAKLEHIIETDDPIEFDGKGRPSLNFRKVRPDLRKLLGKVVITTAEKKVKYGGVERETKYVGLDIKDKMMAMKELAILRGWRKEKLEVDSNEQIMDLVNKRRAELGRWPRHNA